jgi:hypothetical protein
LVSGAAQCIGVDTSEMQAQNMPKVTVRAGLVGSEGVAVGTLEVSIRLRLSYEKMIVFVRL